jgi:hypothetical protein
MNNVPNQKTQDAIAELERDDCIRFSSVEDLRADLNKFAPEHPLTKDMNRLYSSK